MNIRQALNEATNKFQKIGIKSSSLDARTLLKHTINKPIEYLFSQYKQELTESEKVTFEYFVKRRINLEPIAYIIQCKEFYGYEFRVNNKVLIPREESEMLVDIILENTKFNNIKPKTIDILELGTGSGCIAISILLNIPNANIIATDISLDALHIANINIVKHNVQNRINLIHSNWFENLRDKTFDFIISNPPYISLNDISYMTQETINYEPHLALFADNNGLASYYTIAKDAKRLLKKNGHLLVEIGFNQGKSVSKIFHDYGYIVKHIYKDLSSHERVLFINYN